MKVTGHLPRVRQALGLDRAVSYTLLGRGWSILAGPVTMMMIAHFLSAEEQGYYYTFYSVLSLQIFFELGLSIVILQFASHEMSGLEWTEQGTLDGDPVAKARLAGLLNRSMRWYTTVALLMVVTLIPGGILFFRSNHADSSVMWLVPWIAVVIVEAGNITMSPVVAVVEGCGKVSEIALNRFYQGILGSAATWIMLTSHAGLIVTPVLSAVNLLWWANWVYRKRLPFLRDLSGWANQGNVFDWKREVWPFQWKIALSGISGYFIFLIFNPILFMFHGAKTAGQMGMSLSVMSALATVAAAWVGTKASPFGILIAQKQYDRLDKLFFPALWRSTGVMVVASGLFLAADLVLFRMHHRLSERVLPPVPLAFFVATTVLNHVLGAEAVYLRAHKTEPFLWLSVIVALLVASSTYFLGRGSVEAMMAGNFAVTFFGLIWGTWIFVQKRAQWHAEEAVVDVPMVETTAVEV